MEYSNYELVKNLGMLQSHLDIALKNPEATQHEIEEKLLQKTKANIDSEHPDKGGLILSQKFFHFGSILHESKQWTKSLSSASSL